MKRRIATCLLGIILIFALIACNNDIKPSPSPNPSFSPNLTPSKPTTGALKIYINSKDLIFSALDNYYKEYSLQANREYVITLEENKKDFSHTKVLIKTEDDMLIIPLSDSESYSLNVKEKGQLDLAVLTYSEKDKKHVLYTSSISLLANIREYTKDIEDLSIIITKNMEVKEDLVLSRPASLYLNGYTLNIKGSLIIAFQEEGIFNIYLSEEDKLKVNSFYADAPNASINTDKNFFYQDPNYCIRAKSFNGSDLSDEIPVTDVASFLQLIDDNAYPVLYPNSSLLIDNLKIGKEDLLSYYKDDRSDLKISKGLNLNFQESFILQDINLVIESYEGEDIRINHKDKADISLGSIYIDAPYSSLVWVNNPPSKQYIKDYMNVASYQGQDLSDNPLGGEGRDKLIGFETDSKLSLEWTIKGNTIETSIPYSLKESSLEKVEIQIKSSREEITRTLNLRQRPIISIADSEGRIHNYRVIINRLQHNLPQIFIDIDGYKALDPDKEYLSATFSLKADNINKSYSLETTSLDIKGRGNSTWRLFDKKPMKLKFKDQVSILGLKSNRDWVLLANYSDQSLIRNYLALEMGKRLDNLKFTPSSYLVDVFLNGEYQGVYSIGEQIEIAKSRINIDENYEEVNTGYLLEVGGKKDGMVLNWDYFHASNLKWITIRSPKPALMSQGHFNYISDYVKKADKAVINLDNYEDYIDIDSLIDWVILHEFTCNLDSGFRRSCFLYKEKDGKLFMGPAWDFDLAFGNYFRDESYDVWFTNGGETLKDTWTTYLYQDPAFNAKYKARWNQVKEDLKKRALDSISSIMPSLSLSAKENFIRWPNLLGKKTSLQPEQIKDLRTHKEHVDYIINFINNRYDWLDLAINGLP